MNIQTRSVNDLVRIAAAGGGFTLNGSTFAVNDLVRIAAAGSNNQARLVFQNLQHLQTNDLVRIAAAGKGAIHFE